MKNTLWTKAQQQAKGDKGQITIFIVLVFQVLFVFFAMVSNVGLVVHEKINLQNATDIAAMYGAQKQAEVLNAIAHLNYQIRQDWKLLAFRVRVLGEFGRSGHPMRSALLNNTVAPDVAWPPVTRFGTANALPNDYPPMVCVYHSGWVEPGQPIGNTNICQSRNGEVGVTIPPLPQITAYFLPVDAVVASQFQSINNEIRSQCENAGYMNWKMAATFLTSYKMALKQKLTKIKSLKTRLEEGLDIEGNSIAEGVAKTLRANVTSAQVDPQVEWINPFETLSPDYRSDWLKPIRVWPSIFFITNVPGAGCTARSYSLLDIAQSNNFAALGGPNAIYGFQNGHPLFEWTKEPPPAVDPWSIENGVIGTSVGVEKNPWVMIYSGVKVTSSAIKPFFPFLNGHTLTARAFAQPFGSVIGPWSGSVWDSNAHFSSGEKIDKNLPMQWNSNSPPPPLQNQNVPNFSRYPGDPLGLNSALAMSEVAIPWKGGAATAPPIKVQNYQEQPILAYQNGWSLGKDLAGRLELLAISPNIFDMAYYNIDPMAARIFNERDGQNLTNVIPDYMDSADSIRGIRAIITNSITSNVTSHRVKEWVHLLTGWTASNPNEYNVPSGRFGICNDEVPDGASPSSGNCIAGGRAGYSVKLVSEDFLNSSVNLGNTGEGVILNKPPGN